MLLLRLLFIETAFNFAHTRESQLRFECNNSYHSSMRKAKAKFGDPMNFVDIFDFLKIVQYVLCFFRNLCTFLLQCNLFVFYP